MQEIVKENNLFDNLCPLYKHGTSKRKIRHEFFRNIKTELQAYLLGILASDGCLVERTHAVQLHINPIDSELFDLFKIISPDAKIIKNKPYLSNAKVRGRQVQSRESEKIVIQSTILYNDLIKLGIVPGKTYKEMGIPNQIPISLRRHFIRGYFDGDGWCTFHLHAPEQRNREKNYRIKGSAGICCKTKNILEEIQQELSKFDITMNLHYLTRDNMYNITSSSFSNLKKLFSYLYDSADYFLSRKYTKFNYHVNTEVTQLITEYRNAQKVSVSDSNNPSKSAEHPTKDENVR